MAEFEDLFGTKTRAPKVCAVTGQHLQKSDHRIRQRIAGTPFHVMFLRPMTEARLKELTAMAQAAKTPAKDK